ncbi:MAG: hypothetical protein J5733_12325 [Bacteroidaceae bacterium]|nr:hypothetical protein [Bacteroidaceae bacterium]
METKKPPTITQKQLVPYIKKAWNEIQDQLSKIKMEVGPRYNHRNAYETISERFGNPYDCRPAKYFDEYILILNKASKQPASVRGVIADIGRRAVNMFLVNRMKQQQKRQQKKQEKEQSEKA